MLIGKRPCPSCEKYKQEIELLEAKLSEAERRIKVSPPKPSFSARSEKEIGLTAAESSGQCTNRVSDEIANRTDVAEDGQLIGSSHSNGSAEVSGSGPSDGSNETGSSSQAKEERVQTTKMTDAQRNRLMEKRQVLKSQLPKSTTLSREERQKLAANAQKNLIEIACKKHLPALQRNLRKSVTYNDYGVLISDDRRAVASEFLSTLDLFSRNIPPSEAIDLVLRTFFALENKQKANGFSLENLPNDELDFENWVAEALKQHGWVAQVTQGSGDQGIDVVASKNGFSLGIQGKRYTGSVGNKAVQEAFSGAKHMGLAKAAVITNAEFTRSAKELAASTGVLLLSPEDIPTLSDRADLRG